MKLADITQALKAFSSAKGGQVVSAPEATSRARTCRECPMRKKVSGAIGHTSQVLGIATNAAPLELKGYQCGVCGCSLLLLVPALAENLHKDSPEQRALREKKAPNCWLTKAVPTI